MLGPMRFGMAYHWRTAPIALGMGLLPPITYADVQDERLRIQLGPWFVLEAPRELIKDADVARGELPQVPAEHRTTADGYSRLVVRTASSPVARIRFAARPPAHLLIGPPSLWPRFAPLNINPAIALDEIVLTVADPGGLVDALA